MELIIIFLSGIVSWYLTGTDDFLVFYSIYYDTNNPKKRRAAIIGLLLAVILMILIVIMSNITIMIIPFLKAYTFLGGFIPVYLGVKTIISIGDDEENFHSKSSYFLLAFFGFFLNSGDDIIFNLSIILGQELFYQIFFLLGVFFGSLSMIWIITKLHKKVKKDFPVLRGIVLIVVGIILLGTGYINNY